MIAPGLASAYRWHGKGGEIVAQPVGMIALNKGARVVLIDTEDRHFLGELDQAGSLVRIVAGPVTGAQALEAAEKVLAGVDHGSVAEALSTLAIGLVVNTLGLGHAPEFIGTAGKAGGGEARP